ncbi:MAG: SPFH domain-containing protein [Candidatus Methylomirabilia bacterium]
MPGVEIVSGIVPVIIILVFVIGASLRILREYERGVIFRLGKLAQSVFNPGGDGTGPGLLIVIPFVDKMAKVSLRTIAMDVPPQDVITWDNVSVNVNAVVYFRVVDPARALVAVADYRYATSQIVQTTLRSVLGRAELDELLSAREQMNQRLQRIIGEHTDPWGVKVTTVEIKHVDLPQEMVRAMAKQAEAERQRRAKIIHADGEFRAAAKLSEAAEVLGRFPTAVQLRFLQTMGGLAAQQNTTAFWPVPLELFSALPTRSRDPEPRPTARRARE